MSTQKLWNLLSGGSEQQRISSLARALMFSVFVAWTCVAGYAQSAAGAIQGTVSDPSGAVVRGASVHVVNPATGVAHDTVTNDAGFYSVQGIFAGSYVLTFSANGFKQSEQRIDLQAAQTAVISPKLIIGAASEKVEVDADSIQLATYDGPTVASYLDAARIDQVPENGRSINNLITQVTPDAFAGGTFSRPQFNGGQWQATTLIQDGSTNIDLNYGGTLLAQPDPDSVQEVRVETSVSSSKYSAPTTAIVNTKSGTNAWHGSLFETAVNNAIGIARSRTNPIGFTQAHYVRNEFGASIGGPIRIPKLYDGRDKSFFFFSYERYSLRSNSYFQTNVPTVAMRNGDFSAVTNTDGTALQLFDPNTTTASAACMGNPPDKNGNYPANPWCRTPMTFNGRVNVIDPAREAPFAKVMNAITPLPTKDGNPYTGNGFYNLNYPGLNNTTLPTITTRFDHVFDERNNAYARFSSMQYSIAQYYGSQTLPANVAAAGIPAGASNLVGTNQPEYTGAVGYTHIFSPTFVSQFVFGGTWETEAYNNPIAGANTNFEAQLGLPNNFGGLGMPNTSGNLYPLSGSQRQWGSTETILSVNEDLTKTLGKHQIAFGGRVAYEQMGVLPDRSPDTVSFNSQATGLYNPNLTNYGQQSDTGAADADLFLGAASNYSVVLQPGRENWRAQQYALYAQDDFNLNKHLTINLGLRWEALPAPIELNNLVNGFDLKNKAVVLGAPIDQLIAQNHTTQGIITNLQNLGVNFETPQQAGMPDHIMHGNFHIFEPRAGFAYSLFGSGHGTVLRGGVGLYNFPMPIRDIYQNTAGDAPYSLTYNQSYNAAAQSPDGLVNYQLRSPITVVAGQNSANVVSTGSINSILPGVREVFPSSNTPPNQMWEVNGTVEQPLKPDSVLRLTYVYDYSSNLDQNYALNQAMSTYVWEVKTGTPPPQGTYQSVALNPYDNHTYGQVTQIQPSGWSTYNAFTANYQRLYKHGYGYQIAYTIRKGFRIGGNNSRDTLLYPAADYAPGYVPGDGSEHALNRAQNYGINSQFGPQGFIFNGVVDLPIGRGKKLFGKSSRWLDELIGGYQIAWNGSLFQNWTGISASNWGGANPTGGGTMGPIKIYKKKYPVTDCSSGTCIKGYLWYNGYTSPLNVTNPCTGVHAISGLPADYTPYQTPINMDPGAYTCTKGAFKAGNSQYLTNNVPVTTTTNGVASTTYVGFSPGPSTNPFSHTFIHSPWFSSPDASIFKVFPIREGINFRVNVDAFNVFNIQGNNAPNSNGIQYLNASHNTPRQLQITARLTF